MNSKKRFNSNSHFSFCSSSHSSQDPSLTIVPRHHQDNRWDTAKQWRYVEVSSIFQSSPNCLRQAQEGAVQTQSSDSLAMKLSKLTHWSEWLHTLWFLEVIWANVHEVSWTREKAESTSFSFSIRNLWSKQCIRISLLLHRKEIP